jgi:hypothetical protein
MADSTLVKVHEGYGLCKIVGHPSCTEWKDAGGLRGCWTLCGLSGIVRMCGQMGDAARM